jgi:pimeloyl-ACP methyl ester carboxylesterase
VCSPQVCRVWHGVTLYPDYVLQLVLLLRDPIYRGRNVQHGLDQPIVLIPEFPVGDWTLWVMAGWLHRVGYRPYLSGIDWTGCTPARTGELLTQRLMFIVKETGSPVVIVGHGLGGRLARCLGSYVPAGLLPEVVRSVVALGSPIQPSVYPAHPCIRLAFLAWRSLGTMGGGEPPDVWDSMDNISAPLPAGVGFAAIFSHQDEIVDWRACVDPQGNNYRVSGRHLGLVVNREVYQILADMLSSWPHRK